MATTRAEFYRRVDPYIFRTIDPIWNIEFGTQRMAGEDGCKQVPKRVAFSCFSDSWLKERITTQNWEDDDGVATYQMRIFIRGQKIHTGMIDLNSCQYFEKTDTMRIVTYDCIRLIEYNASETSESGDMQKATLDETILLLIGQVLAAKYNWASPTINEYTIFDTKPVHEIQNEELFTVNKKKHFDNIPSDWEDNIIASTFLPKFLNAGNGMHQFFILIGYVLLSDIGEDESDYYWYFKVWKLFNNTQWSEYFYQAGNYIYDPPNNPPWSDIIIQKIAPGLGLSWADTTNTFIFDGEPNTLIETEVIDDGYRIKFTGDIIPNSLWFGSVNEQWETYEHELDEINYVGALKAFLNIYLFFIMTDKDDEVEIRSRDYVISSTIALSRPNTKASPTIRFPKREFPETSLSILSGNTSIFAKHLKVWQAQYFQGELGREFDILDIDNDVQFLKGIVFEGENFKPKELKRNPKTGRTYVKGLKYE